MINNKILYLENIVKYFFMSFINQQERLEWSVFLVVKNSLNLIGNDNNRKITAIS